MECECEHSTVAVPKVGRYRRPRRRDPLLILTFGFFLSLLFLGFNLSLSTYRQKSSSAWLSEQSFVRLRRGISNSSNLTTSSEDKSCSWEGKTYPTEIFELLHWSKKMQQYALPVYFLGALYMFVALAIVCDEFFVPSLEVIIDRWEMSEDVAGATFMAAGGSAPELFTSLVGMLFSNSVDVGIGTVIGSAVFNVLFVIAVCAFGSPTVLILTWWPLCRDTIFYALGLILIIIFFADSKIGIYESIILFCWYITYCTFMYFNENIEGYVKEKAINSCTKFFHSEDARDKDRLSKAGMLMNSGRRKTICIHTALALPVGLMGASTGLAGKQMNGATGDLMPTNNDAPSKPAPLASVDEEGQEEEGEGGEESKHEEIEDPEPTSLAWPSQQPWYRKLLYLCLFPIMLALILTVPDPKRGKPGSKHANVRISWWGYKLYALTFFNSIAWIAVFSYLMVWWVERIGFLVCIPSVIMGLTFLAAGTSVPDLITSYIVAKKGFGDMALSSSIGSNLFDICVGLPIPWLIYVAINLIRSGASSVDRSFPFNITVSNEGMFCYILMLFSMLCIIFVLIILLKWRLSKMMGVFMMCLYGVFLTVAILIGFDVFACPICAGC